MRTSDLTGPIQEQITAVQQNWLLRGPVQPCDAGHVRRSRPAALPGPAALVGRVRRQVSDRGNPGIEHPRGGSCTVTWNDSSPSSLTHASRRLSWPLPQRAPPHRLCPNIQGKPGGTWDAWGHYHIDARPAPGMTPRKTLPPWPPPDGSATFSVHRFLGDKHLAWLTPVDRDEPRSGSSLCLLFRKTGEKRYLDLAEQIVREFAAVDPSGKPLAGDYFRRGLAGEDFYRRPNPGGRACTPFSAWRSWPDLRQR